MDIQTHDKVALYVRNQLAASQERLYAYTINPTTNVPYPKREGAEVLEEYIHNYQTKRNDPRWVALVGLRGVGKTTLMAQIFNNLQCEQNHKLYISLDEAKKVLGVEIQDILSVYEEILGSIFEKLETPVYIFLDEVQYGTRWAGVLKSIYDRSRNVFIFISGSAAVLIQTDADLSRRMVIEKLYPLSFPEYMFIKQQKEFPRKLAKEIQQKIFSTKSAEDLFLELKKIEQEVLHYWLGIDRLAIDNYLKYATLPFTLQYTNETVIYQQIEQTLTNIITVDIPKLKKFDAETIAKINSILYAIASADVVSLKKLADMFDIAINTLIDVLETCAKAELLMRVYPYGENHYTQVRKASKYLFLSSAYRSMFFHLIGSTAAYEQYKGRLLEDVVGMYLYRILKGTIGTAITYDSSENSADFILSLQGRKIPLEVGFGEKSYQQLEQTMKKVNPAFGIVVSNSKLRLSENKKMVSIPLEYFLLLL